MRKLGVVECVSSKFSWFIPSEPYWAYVDEFGDYHVADKIGDLFPVDGSMSSTHNPPNYEFKAL